MTDFEFCRLVYLLALIVLAAPGVAFLFICLITGDWPDFGAAAGAGSAPPPLLSQVETDQNCDSRYDRKIG